MRRIGLVAAVLLLTAAGGAAAKSLVSDLMEPEPTPTAIQKAAVMISELQTEKDLYLTIEEIKTFLEDERDAIVREYAALREIRNDRQIRLIDTIENTYSREELESVAAIDPFTAKHFMALIVTYGDEEIGMPLDAASWPDFFPENEFGYGMLSEFKCYLWGRIQKRWPEEAK